MCKRRIKQLISGGFIMNFFLYVLMMMMRMKNFGKMKDNGMIKLKLL